MGIEREGHFVYRDWCNCDEHELVNLAAELKEQLRIRGVPHVARVYHDRSGSFLIEFTTEPISPKEAAQAVIKISCIIKEIAQKELNIERVCFGTMNADFLESMPGLARKVLKDFDGEVYDRGGSQVLAGHAQHANVSLWCNGDNLFYYYPYTAKHTTLGDAMANQAMTMLPGMILPSRGGDNFYRIANNALLSTQTIDIDLNASGVNGEALNWRTQIVGAKKEDPKGPSNKHQYTRMEFRQGVADADPLDIALASAIPITKACLECVVKGEDGKAVLKGGIPQFDCNKVKRASPMPMPRSQEEAAALFNTADNPNFEYLNALAKARIQKLEKEISNQRDQAPTLVKIRSTKIQLRNAHALKDIGTKLHHMYCQQYGLESQMPFLKVAKERM